LVEQAAVAAGAFQVVLVGLLLTEVVLVGLAVLQMPVETEQ